MVSLTVISRTQQESVGPSPDAALYAVQELARRAGVSREVFRTWRVDFADRDFVNVLVQPGTRKRIRFPRIGAGMWNQIQRGVFHTATASWPSHQRRTGEFTADLRIPFCSSSHFDLGPLFVSDSRDSLTCAVDLLASTVLTLARFEETLPSPKDVHGRFPASASVAWRGGFLHRPIVDEYGLALERGLELLLPGWRPLQRRLCVKVSHDVDEIGIPFSLRGALAKTVRNGRPILTLRDLLAPLLRGDTTHQVLLKRLAQHSLERGLDSAIYWKSSRFGPYDTGYDVDDPRIRKLIDLLRAENVEMGIHPSYATFHSPKLFRSEVEKLSALLGSRDLGGRQDYLRWSPESWVEWDAVGLAYDSSVGFADHIGFRAGTCIPYRPWLWSQQRRADLVEIPLVAMDSTLFGYMNLSAEQALALLLDLCDRCRAAGGVFTLAWHNTSLANSSHAAIYRVLLDQLASSGRYDWKSDLV